MVLITKVARPKYCDCPVAPGRTTVCRCRRADLEYLSRMVLVVVLLALVSFIVILVVVP